MLKRHKFYSGTGISIITLVFLLGWSGTFAQQPIDPYSLIDTFPANQRAQPDESEFTLARMVYTETGGRGYSRSWRTDWPDADNHFILGIQRLTNIRVSDEGISVRLTDPELFKYPFLYAVEVGHWNLTNAEVLGLREYLKRGGFLFCDDFWGSYEWEIFRQNFARVLPDARISDIPLTHPVFNCYYNIDELVQIPNVRQAIYSTRTYEQDGYVPHCMGVFDENGRLMVIINWNTDLGDAWEWADLPELPAKFSTHAYKLGINAIVYAMTH